MTLTAMIFLRQIWLLILGLTLILHRILLQGCFGPDYFPADQQMIETRSTAIEALESDNPQKKLKRYFSTWGQYQMRFVKRL